MTGSPRGVLVAALPQRGAFAAACELLSAGRALAGALKEPLAAALFGSRLDDRSAELVERGAERVLSVEAGPEPPGDEACAATLASLCAGEGFSTILLPSTVAGRSLAGLLSVKLKAAVATEVFDLAVKDGGLVVKRAGYGGNVVAEVSLASPLRVMTLQGMVWPQAPRTPGRAGSVERVELEKVLSRARTVGFEAAEAGEIDLGGADKVVSGGRGLGGPDGFKPVRELAALLGAAVGASRAAVDAGWIPYRHQVGLTGRTIRPSLYMACGISGQIQHLAGMSSAKTLVAINSDPDCPMMQAATFAVVADLQEFLPLLCAEIKRRRG